jgi:hypothetical protein
LAGCNHLREFKIVLESDVDGTPALPTEITIPEKMVLFSNRPSSQRQHKPLLFIVKFFLMSISFVFRRSLKRSQNKDLILGLYFNIQIQEEKMGASICSKFILYIFFAEKWLPQLYDHRSLPSGLFI